MINTIAQINLFPGSGYEGKGPLGLEGLDPNAAPQIFNTFISSTIGVMTIVAIVWFIFVFLGGAYGIITAGGDKASLEAASKKIFSGITGLVVVVAGIFIIDFIGRLIGIPNILNPAELLEQIVNF